jgi:DNA-binding HxlR family transcriptional regulator
MALLDLLGRRWALRILWELRSGRLHFRELRAACGEPSPSVLNARLHELVASALVDKSAPEGYGLTPIGRDLSRSFLPLVAWSDRWARTLAARDEPTPARARAADRDDVTIPKKRRARKGRAR